MTLGKCNGAASLTLQAGTGNVAITGATTTTITLGKSNGTGTITIGSSSATQIVAIGAGAGASTVNIANGAGANTIGIGTGAGGDTINIGTGGVNVITIGDAYRELLRLLLYGGSAGVTIDGITNTAMAIGL